MIRYGREFPWRVSFSPITRLKFIMESYWDLYVAYVHRCVEYNKQHDIDPHHYRMEWNHFLPVCIFGDQPVGHYLLLKQHAIASALQTLAFKKMCVCTWHEKYLPPVLLDLIRPVVKQQRSSNGEYIKSNNLGIFSPENRGSGARATVLRQVGVHDPFYKHSQKAQSDRSKAGQIGSTVTNSQVWVSLVDGFSSNAGAVAKHNKANGWDPNARVQVR